MSKYFNEFPLIAYDSAGDGNTKLVTHLLLRVGANSQLVNDVSFFDNYDLKDFETPEMIADRVYGSVHFHWVVLLVNNITDPFYDWPLGYFNLVKFINNKYSNPNAIHHYEDADGYVVNSDAAFATAITNFTHEETVNETKRRIRVLKTELLKDFVNEYKFLMNINS